MIIDFHSLNKRFKGDFMCKPLEKLCGKSAEYILDNYGEKNVYPIDIVQIVNNIGGISLGSMDFTNLDRTFCKEKNEKVRIVGAVRVFDNAVQIIYSKNLDPDKDNEHSDMTENERKEKLKRSQRFTIAHELAHCCLHINANERQNYIEFRSHSSKKGYDKREEVANIFAGELLMPKYILDEFVRNPEEYDLSNVNGDVSVEKLADAFWVNNHVMVERLRYLRKTENVYNKICFDIGKIKGAEDLAI